MPELKGNESLTDMMMTMAKGNPGAMNVLGAIINHDELDGLDKLQLITTMDAMEIRADRVWLAWKDYAGQDMKKLLTGVQQRDQELIDICNKYGPGDPPAKSDI